MNSETKICQSCKAQFTIEPDDFGFYNRIDVPPPKDCPVCRQRQRMIFRNFKTLYKRKSDLSGTSVISMYSPQSPYKIYTHEEWWSDSWDPKIYGREFDFNRTFFEQFHELLLAVPRFNLMRSFSENSEYINFGFRSKNCYMTFGCVDTEDSMYSHIIWESKDSADALYLHKSELCYECIDCIGCYRLFWSQECESCTQGIGLFDCRSCSNCIGCVGLKQKSYCIFNEQKTKEECEAFLRDHPLYDPGTLIFIRDKTEELRKSLPQRHFFGSHNDSVSGNHIYNGRNILDSFDVKGGENSRFIYTSRNAKDSYDVAFSPDIELCYFSITTLKCNRVYFCHVSNAGSDMYYSDYCYNTHNIFGCAGLKGGEYCILNKQYSKEEYEKLKYKIIEHMKKTGEWGEFFPASFSPFAYNESIAQEYFPLSKQEAIAFGSRWEDHIPRTSGQETMSDIPKDLSKFDSDFLTKQVFQCNVCGYNYRVVAQEIEFYKRLNLSLPQECFNCRHARRMKARNIRKLWSGKCAKCGAGFQTSYSTEQQKEYKIYCETCYQNEMS